MTKKIEKYLEDNKSGVASVLKNQNVYVFNPRELISEIEQLLLHDVSQRSELLKVKYKPIIKDLQQQLTDANEEYADGKLTEVKWLRHTAFLKGKISALLNL